MLRSVPDIGLLPPFIKETGIRAVPHSRRHTYQFFEGLLN